jgi:hypothetical protein
MTFPPGRNHGSIATAGDTLDGKAFWFSQPTNIPTEPTLNKKEYRTMNVDISSGPNDWSRYNPWRAAGSAPVLGSGCGVAGGSPLKNMTGNGGTPPPGFDFGDDGLLLPPLLEPAVWPRGSVQEVAWAILANHGGGYSWRLCKKDTNVSEECFQQNTLKFSGNSSWIRYGEYLSYGEKASRYNTLPIPDFEIPLTVVNQGTHPAGSEWARNPVPACRLCDAAAHAACSDDAKSWIEQQHCSQTCSGLNMTYCPPFMTQFAEPLPGVSGFDPILDGGMQGFAFNVVNKVEVPDAIPEGEYLLSWRWDCEQSNQIWENCADLIIT